MPGLAQPSGNPEDAKYARKGRSIKTRAGAGEEAAGLAGACHGLTSGSRGENSSRWEACALQLPM